MPDLRELLRTTQPSGLSHVDLDGIANEARRRNRRRRVALAAPAVALFAASVAVGAGVLRDDTEPLVMTTPSGVTLTEPVGEWRAGAPAPFGARANGFSAVLDDGRVLVWGRQPYDEQGAVLDGGIYDVDRDTWTPIPDAPLPLPSNGRWVQLAGNRLLVVDLDYQTGDLGGALYDIESGSWTELPSTDRVRHVISGVGWDGETVAVVRLDPGAPDLSRIDEPVTLRWTVGDDTWSDGALSPLGLRVTNASAFDGKRIAIWGGSTTNHWDAVQTPSQLGPDPGVLGDGAIYDVAEDSWEMLPDAPIEPRSNPAAGWFDGRLRVGGGHDRFNNPGEILSSAAEYDPSTRRWTELPPPPTAGAAPNDGLPSLWSDNAETPIWVRVSQSGHSGPQTEWFLGPEGWEEAPLNDLHRWGDLIVATSRTTDNPGDGPFEVRLRAANGQWLEAADAPFVNRMGAFVEVVGDRLVIIGGREGVDIEAVGDTWALDLVADN